MTEVAVLLGVDLRWMEDEDRGDIFEHFDLFDK